MQKFRTLAAFFVVEKQWPEKERRRRRRRKRNNAKYYGHYVVCTAPLEPILKFCPGLGGPTLLTLDAMSGVFVSTRQSASSPLKDPSASQLVDRIDGHHVLLKTITCI